MHRVPVQPDPSTKEGRTYTSRRTEKARDDIALCRSAPGAPQHKGTPRTAATRSTPVRRILSDSPLLWEGRGRQPPTSPEDRCGLMGFSLEVPCSKPSRRTQVRPRSGEL